MNMITRSSGRATRHVLDVMRSLGLCVLLARAKRHWLHGIEVVDLLEGDSDPRVRIVDDALAQIAIHAFDAFQGVRSDVRRIVLFESGPEFWPHSRTCVLPDPAGLSVTAVAMMIVHEGMHAHLFRSGSAYEPETQSRVERACVDAEIAFVERIPGEERLVAWARQKLETPWWTPQDVFLRRREELSQAGAPRWVLRLHKFLFAPKEPTVRD